jgi:quercetin dioxygenase-like cupin family protein
MLTVFIDPPAGAGRFTCRAPAVPTRLLETDRAIVTRWTFPPGAHTGWHRHGYDYVVVPETTAVLTIETEAGVTEAAITQGVPYARAVGVAHDVINEGATTVSFIEIEMK